MSYRTRRLARADRLRQWAERRQEKAAATLASADRIAAQIPMGQPILVGHHSERRHRRDLERIHNRTARGFEHQEKGAEMARRADEIERQAERSVYRDDDDAIERLEERIADLEALRDRRKAVNREIRKGPGWEQRIAPPLTDDERADLLRSAQFAGTTGYPPYVFQNLAGNLARQRARLSQLRQERATIKPPATEPPADEGPDEMPPPLSGPIADLAAALNPDGGALGIDAPFALTAETPDERRDEQPNLFGDEGD